MRITIGAIEKYQVKFSKLKAIRGDCTIGEFKTLGRKLRDKYNLTDMEAINILRSDHEKILAILKKYEKGK